MITEKNFNLFEKDSQKNYIYSFMKEGRHAEVFFSLPTLKANLAVGKFGGPGDMPYIYLDSLLIQYTDQGLNLVYSFDGKKQTGQAFYFETFLDEDGKITRDHDNEHRLYMEYDIVVGDMGGKGYETAAVITNFPRHICFWFIRIR